MRVDYRAETEAQYQAERHRGRIRAEDIDAVLADEADAPIWGQYFRQGAHMIDDI